MNKKIKFLGNGVVWVQGGKNLRFVDGVIETDDPKEIERLKGYPTEPKDAMKEYEEGKKEPEKKASKK